VKVKGVDVSSLTKRQQGATKRHAKHHTAATLKKMVSGMKKGKSFTEVHKKAKKI
jgi:hypothetical protein|tara:strand:+ start:653 stop:817 length:165 start_codon:yes stop_codon:yes gene_type:complete